MPSERIYLIEDEQDISELVRYNLSLEGYQVEVFHSGEEGLNAVVSNPPDLLVLDLMLPGLDGLEICRRIKGEAKTKELPIVMVTAKGEERDVVLGLEMGADDYLSKPFSPKVLIARIRAVLRRASEGGVESAQATSADPNLIERGALSIHLGRREVQVESSEIVLTNSEFQILHFLAKRPGWVFTRSQIVDAIHGENYAVTDRSIDFQMVGLRKKLKSMGHMIETVRGVGYRFRDAD